MTIRSFMSVLVLAGSMMLMVALPTSAQTTDNTITVTGTGTATSQPNMATLVVGVEKSGTEILPVYGEVNTTIETVVNALENLGIADEDMRTTGLDVYVNPVFRGDGMTPQNEARITNRINITIRDLSQIESVIDTAISNGANVVFGLQFGVADSSTLESEARRNALADARARADEIADNLGVEISGVVNVVEGSGGNSFFQTRNNAMLESADGGGAVVEPGRISVSIATQVTFQFSNE